MLKRALLLAAAAMSCRAPATEVGRDDAWTIVCGHTNLSSILGHAELPRRVERAWRLGSGSLVAELRGRDGVYVALGSTWFRWQQRQPAETAPTPSGRALVLHGAEVDVVHVGAPGAWEELRIVRHAHDVDVVRYHVERGPDLALLRARDGRLELVDDRGRVRASTEPLRAEDADRRLLPVELHVDGDEVELRVDLRGARRPVVVDPAWSAVASLGTGRRSLSAVLLSSGRVLVTGGQSASGVVSTAELYDPTNNTWTATGSLSFARRSHAAVRLTTGKVLIVGGITTTAVTAAELYDPATGTFSTAGVPTFAGSTLAALSDGRAMSLGGIKSNRTSLFDPATNTWSEGPPNPVSRQAPGVVTLPDGKLLAAGGLYQGGVDEIIIDPKSTAELFDPTTSTWSVTTPMAARKSSPRAYATIGGKTLVYQGTFAELYDATTATWSTITGSTSVMMAEGHVRLSTGQVLFVAGTTATGGEEEEGPVGGSTSELFDGARFRPASNLLTARGSFALVGLADGRALAIGGVLPTDASVLASVELFAAQTDAAPCTQDGDCTSGYCVDSVCCNARCAEACKACDVSGSIGACVAVDGLPHGSRTCVTYACTAGACRTACAADAQCASTAFCNGNACVDVLAKAASCARDRQCASGHCVDGVCCESACTGQCEACDGDVAGTCAPVKGGPPHGARTVCTATASTCALWCDGSDRVACHFPPPTISCSANACAIGVETHASFCDGSGGCNDVTKPCGAYACGDTACRTTCATNAQCASGFVCLSGLCAPAPGLGKPCSGACGSGLSCVDGVCCATSSCAADEACHLGAAPGTCRKKNGATCSSADACGSGYCVDGVCCETACSGICEACDGAGASGSCRPVAGTPRGARDACATGAAACEARRCDGLDRKACSGFADTTVVCAPARCDATTFTAGRTCDGAGACTPAKAAACRAYRCTDAGCRTDCVTATDCAPGYACDQAQCVPPVAKCSEDALTRIATDGVTTACHPFRCTDGRCIDRCTSTSDCASGYECASSGECARLADAPADGGCSLGRHASWSLGWALAACAVSLARRRRHRRPCAR